MSLRHSDTSKARERKKKVQVLIETMTIADRLKWSVTLIDHHYCLIMNKEGKRNRSEEYSKSSLLTRKLVSIIFHIEY